LEEGDRCVERRRAKGQKDTPTIIAVGDNAFRSMRFDSRSIQIRSRFDEDDPRSDDRDK